MGIEQFIDSLISLRIILEKTKINVIEKLKIIKMEEITIKELKELEELERSLDFVAIKTRFLGRPNKFREITRKKINEIEKLKTEIKEMKILKIEAIKLKSSKLLSDLNIEKVFEMEEIKEIETTPEKLKIPTTMINTIKKSLISEYMHDILMRRKYCVP